MEISEVWTKRDEKRFLQVPRELYRNDEQWICPPDREIKDIFDPARNTSFKAGAAKRWYIINNGKLTGRIAAFYDHNNWKPGKPKTGGLGFFESVNDQQAASALFDIAVQWLKDKGVEAIDAPVNFGERDTYWGLLVEGFSAPSYQDNYNPPYYRALFEAYGFEKHILQTTSRITPATFNKERIDAIVKRVERNPDISFHHFERGKLNKYARDFVAIYNAAWKNHEDFTPVSEELIRKRMKTILPVIQDDTIWFAYVNDKPSAFLVAVPDINPLLRSFNGRFTLWEKMLLMYRLRTRNVKRLRGIVFGVVPEHQNKGLDAGIVMNFYYALRKHPGIEEVELSWVGDFNPRMLAFIRAIGAVQAKQHITYRKILPQES